MAVPAIVGRRATGSSVQSVLVNPTETRVRRLAPGRGYLLILLALTCVAVFSRVYTTNSLAGEPTPDEYLYGVHARDLARSWAANQAVSLENLGVEGRSVG